MVSQVPHQYTTIEDGLMTTNQKAYDFNKVSMGFGTKSDFTNGKATKFIPGPKYDAHEINSIAYKSLRENPKTMNGFFNKYDKWDKTCYAGMEQHFYGREGKGPGAYV